MYIEGAGPHFHLLGSRLRITKHLIQFGSTWCTSWKNGRDSHWSSEASNERAIEWFGKEKNVLSIPDNISSEFLYEHEEKWGKVYSHFHPLTYRGFNSPSSHMHSYGWWTFEKLWQMESSYSLDKMSRPFYTLLKSICWVWFFTI